eukprot:839451-Pleurochrysis_carterae.AAC.1
MEGSTAFKNVTFCRRKHYVSALVSSNAATLATCKTSVGVWTRQRPPRIKAKEAVKNMKDTEHSTSLLAEMRLPE